MWRLFKVHLWGTCTTSLLPLSILTTSMFSGSYSSPVSHTVFQTPYAETQHHPLASSSSPCLNQHGIRQWQILMTNSHFWRPPLLVTLPWCFPRFLFPLWTSSPIPQPPPHLPHLSILPCRTAWAGPYRKNACTTNSTRAVQEDNIVWAANNTFHSEGIFVVFDPECTLKSPLSRRMYLVCIVPWPKDFLKFLKWFLCTAKLNTTGIHGVLSKWVMASKLVGLTSYIVLLSGSARYCSST